MEDLYKKQHRKNFYLAAFVVIFVICGLQLALSYWNPYLYGFGEWAADFLNNLLSSLFVTVLIGAFLFWIRPEILDRASIAVISPKEINPLLKRAASRSTIWFFRGACGRYTRSTTLPSIDKASRDTGSRREMTLCIIDPKDENICEEYARYRNSLKSKDKYEWTKESVQMEALATAVSALWYGHHSSLFRTEVYLLRQFSTFRLDISDEYAIVTKEDPQEAAIRANSASFFYDSYVSEIELIKSSQSRQVTLQRSLRLPKEFDLKSLREVIENADLLDTPHVQNPLLERILELVTKPESPYE